jgi:hypothetical protein
MPYVEGESVRDRLNREKQLPIPDALKIASEVADALGFAHEHNVIHLHEHQSELHSDPAKALILGARASLARMRQELLDVLEQQQRANTRFQQEVMERLASMAAEANETLCATLVGRRDGSVIPLTHDSHRSLPTLADPSRPSSNDNEHFLLKSGIFQQQSDELRIS